MKVCSIYLLGENPLDSVKFDRLRKHVPQRKKTKVLKLGNRCLRLEILCVTDQVKEEPSNIYRAQNHTKEEGKLVSAAASLRDVTGGRTTHLEKVDTLSVGRVKYAGNFDAHIFLKKIVYCAS